MRRTWIALWLALLPAAAAAQGASAPADAVAAELARVNATLKEIAALLNRQLDGQSLDLLMKRAQLSESQVTELERRLQSAQGELRSLESERSTLELRLKEASAQLEQARPDSPTSEFETIAAKAAGELKRVRLRIGQLAQETSALESELATHREELRSWQSLLDRRLAKHTG